ncbi:hypothetical protein EYC84_000938 [Monilinia fructicola]|uniref:Uncharacterized protein n=1 Tax=Monilinia fructicola TaxID=38448 RepID=A0A5M9JKL8_MONFR|nr:hypothetical protein EYC84_000938 [Monilinia fructicola]
MVILEFFKVTASFTLKDHHCRVGKCSLHTEYSNPWLQCLLFSNFICLEFWHELNHVLYSRFLHDIEWACSRIVFGIHMQINSRLYLEIPDHY